MNSSLATMAVATGFRSPFTASQWQELEHQALIFKYLIAGLPVPPDLVFPIRKSFESMAARLFHHPSMNYCSFYGKKVDPEPGRCRRTDGKKWRCAKDAYPDSKYCERHMHRGRNRSRKPVEMQTNSQSSSSTVTSLTSTTTTTANGSSGSGGSFQNLPLHSIGNSQDLCIGSNPLQLQMESASYGIGNKDYRYLHGMKPDMDERTFYSEASGSARGLGVDPSLDNTWRLLPSRVSSFSPSISRSSSIMQANYPQMHSLQDLGHTNIATALSKQHQQQQHCFFGSEFGSSEPVKQEGGQSLRPFFDEWPKTRDSWSDLEDERSNRTSYSTTQLSMSLPMTTSSNFSATSSRALNDD